MINFWKYICNILCPINKDKDLILNDIATYPDKYDIRVNFFNDKEWNLSGTSYIIIPKCNIDCTNKNSKNEIGWVTYVDQDKFFSDCPDVYVSGWDKTYPYKNIAYSGHIKESTRRKLYFNVLRPKKQSKKFKTQLINITESAIM